MQVRFIGRLMLSCNINLKNKRVSLLTWTWGNHILRGQGVFTLSPTHNSHSCLITWVWSPALETTDIISGLSSTLNNVIGCCILHIAAGNYNFWLNKWSCEGFINYIPVGKLLFFIHWHRLMCQKSIKSNEKKKNAILQKYSKNSNCKILFYSYLHLLALETPGGTVGWI